MSIGTCLCGKVEFELLGATPKMYKCFCTLCQKQGGTASNASAIIRQNRFRWLAGEDTISQWSKPTGFSSHFCKDCGCPVPNEFQGQYVWVPMGLLPADTDTDVVAYLFLNDKPAWENPPEVAHPFEAGPPSVEALVSLLEA